MKQLFWFFGLALAWQQPAFGFRVVHFNIKELDSEKLAQAKESPQLQAVHSILRSLNPDILSINEMQYDLPGVPTPSHKSTGQNASRFADFLSRSFHLSFYPANTGAKALRRQDGTFSTNPNDPQWEQLVDHVNFGIFPHQYSTAGFFGFPITEPAVVSALPWRAFNPARDLRPYQDATGKPFPETMELFDKNFTDTRVKIGSQWVHVVLLHTVPAYNFGNDKGLNIVRNQDQLRFLEWYLTGKSEDIESKEIAGVRPLPPNTPFIALGDWNTDIQNNTNPGSVVLRRLGKHCEYWHKASPTYEGGFTPTAFKAQFDYILHSKHLSVSDGGVYWPPANRKDLGCKPVTGEPPEGFQLVSYQKDGAECFAHVSADYYQAKQASDHFPIWADFRLEE